MASPNRTLSDLLAQSSWTQDLGTRDLERVRRETVVRDLPAGALACRKGEPVDSWIGIIDGIIKIASVSPEGKPVTFTGVASGGWLGEGSLLKDEARRYDVVAIRSSRVAYMPRQTFQWLLDSSISFNRFLLRQLNERLGQFIAMVEFERLLGPDARVSRCLSQMFNPVLYPGQNRRIDISQHEIAYLTGLSRQRVNQALKRLQTAGLLRVEYGAIVVDDPARLATFES